jgi:2-polyprenyl-3-methyl-5-hydroxy-6-metoxy-1,4-benzoquinol methylase
LRTEDLEVLRKKVDQRNSIIFSKRYHRGLISAVLKAIPPQSKRILDIGCGYGNITKFLETRGQTIVGLDLGGLFYRPYISQKLSFLKSDALHIPFGDDTFDCVVSLDVIEHIDNDLSFLREVNRVLKPEGFTIIETPNRCRLSMRILSLLKDNSQMFPKSYGHDELLGDIIHIREYTKTELEKIFNLANFKEINISGHWFGFTTPEIGMQKAWRAFEPLSQSWIIKAVK